MRDNPLNELDIGLFKRVGQGDRPPSIFVLLGCTELAAKSQGGLLVWRDLVANAFIHPGDCKRRDINAIG